MRGKIEMDRDEEVCLDPYLVVRFTWTASRQTLQGMKYQALVNDGRLSKEAVMQKVKEWLRKQFEDGYEQEILVEAREILERNQEDEVRAGSKE
jgi:hypothetical protein